MAQNTFPGAPSVRQGESLQSQNNDTQGKRGIFLTEATPPSPSQAQFIDDAVRAAMQNIGYIEDSAHTAEFAEKKLRSNTSDLLNSHDFQHRVLEIEELRRYIDKRGQAFADSLLNQFASIVALRASAFTTTDHLIEQPLSRKMGVGNLYNLSIHATASDLFDSMRIAEYVRDLKARLASEVKDQKSTLFSQTIADVLSRLKTASEIPSINAMLAIQTLVKQAFQIAQVLEPPEDAETKPSATPQDIAQDLRAKLEVLQNSNTPVITRASKQELGAIISQLDAIASTDQPDQFTEATGSRASINIDAQDIDEELLNTLIRNEIMERESSIQARSERLLRTARAADLELTEERNKYMKKIMEIVSSANAMNSQRPSSSLQAAMQSALAQISGVNETYAPLAQKGKPRALWSNRNRQIVTRFAEVTANQIVVPGTFARGQSQAQTRSIRDLAAIALSWFQEKTYFDPRTKKIVVFTRTTTFEQGILQQRNPSQRRLTRVMDRFSRTLLQRY